MQANKALVAESIGVHGKSEKDLFARLGRIPANPRVGYVMLTNSKQGGDGKTVRADVLVEDGKHLFAYKHSLDKTPRDFSTQTFPYARYRDQAHQLAVEEGKKMFPDSEVVYKSSDSDGLWDDAEVANWVSVADSLQDDYDPEVVTSAYRFKDESEGNVKEAGDIWFESFNGFLDKAAVEENEKREALYKINALAIYYPEPTTLYNDAARQMMNGAEKGQSEGMKMVVKLVNTMNPRGVKIDKNLGFLKYDKRMTTTTSVGARREKLYLAYVGAVSRLKKGEEPKKSIIAELAANDAQSSYAVTPIEMVRRYKANGLKV
ncbi:hypothetical protein [Alteromonas sp. a30]|uniref:hypothetical protein n=1 Tax=Alteromonas sp. a30 TaxID=2730917 RepID=UPI0022816062|nr:hypothetical protein [Alteromonas sp. a30]MCY7296499.1 hypothetical protein [Alteromonas sp. a30]